MWLYFANQIIFSEHVWKQKTQQAVEMQGFKEVREKAERKEAYTW